MRGRTLNCHKIIIGPEYRMKEIGTTLTFLEPAASGINAPWYARLGEREFGYFKNCSGTDRTMEELEFVLALLGKQLGVSMADTHLILDEKNQKLGSFSVEVAGKGERFYTADEIKKEWIRKQTSIPDWALRADEIYRSHPKIEPMPDYRFSCIDDADVLCEVIRFVYYLLSEEGKWDLSQAFTDMVLFDGLIRQKDRTMGNFGIIKGDDGTVKMAALFDSATITMPGLEESKNGFCNVLTNRAALARAIRTLFPKEYMSFVGRLGDFAGSESVLFETVCRQVLPPDSCKKLIDRLSWREIYNT